MIAFLVVLAVVTAAVVAAVEHVDRPRRRIERLAARAGAR